MKIRRLFINVFVLFLCFSSEIYAKDIAEYTFFASKQEARKIAEVYRGELTGYNQGIATIRIPQIFGFYSQEETKQDVLEYKGVKIYPDIVITLEDEEGSFDKQDYLADLGVKEAWKVSRGEGIKVAVIDSGVDASHEDLSDAVIYTGTTIPQECYGDLLDEAYKGTADYLGHGTHVAGIIGARDNGSGTVGIAPECSIISIKALEKRNGKGYGKTSWLAMAIIDAVEREADVINLSVGGVTVGDTILHEAIRRAYDANIPVVCASGNNASQRMFYPAAYTETIAVSSVCKESDNYIFAGSYSNFGSWIDFCAPGTNIYSTFPNGYKSMTGTSMACPMVTGAVTLALSKNPDLTLNQLNTYLKKTVVDLGDSGKDDLYGYGMVDIKALMGEFTEKIAPEMPTTSIPGGHYLLEGTEIKLSTNDSDATIYYTLDGSDPTVDSKVYNGGIFVGEKSVENVIIKAVAINQWGLKSETGVFQYHILPEKKELIHLNGEVKNGIFPMYGASTDNVSEKNCRKYSMLVPNGKKVSLCLVDSASELVWRVYDNNATLIGDYKDNERKVVWKNTTDSTREISLCIIWNSESERLEDLLFSFQWTMEDFQNKEENVDISNTEVIYEKEENELKEEKNINDRQDVVIEFKIQQEAAEVVQNERNCVEEDLIMLEQDNKDDLNEQKDKQEQLDSEQELEISSLEEIQNNIEIWWKSLVWGLFMAGLVCVVFIYRKYKE